MILTGVEVVTSMAAPAKPKAACESKKPASDDKTGTTSTDRPSTTNDQPRPFWRSKCENSQPPKSEYQITECLLYGPQETP